MINYKNIFVIEKGNFYFTNGLKSFIGIELKINKGLHTKDKYFNILKYLVDYILDSKPKFSSGQTIVYHSWLLKLDQIEDKLFEIREAKPNGNGFQQGVENAIKVVEAQKDQCSKLEITPFFPTFSQNIVISKGVYEGLEVEAVRYPSPASMTGWWITTDLYDDDPDSLMNVHYFHVAFKRPDLLKHFALPYGFRFNTYEKKENIWYDELVLKE